MKPKKIKKHLNVAFTSLMLLIIIGLTGCAENKKNIQKENWGVIQNKQVHHYKLTNSNGMVMGVTNYGAIITSVLVPDKDGKMEDVVLGFDNLQQYLDPNPCFGAAVGRFANRIRNGEFIIDSTIYQLTKNDGEHCIHGGDEFNKVVWDSEIVENELGTSIKLRYVSKDGTNGFPGNLDAYITYTLTENNAIHVRFEAETDKPTHVNMTQHSYFNLRGDKELIYDHLIKIDADNYTEIDEFIIPTGAISTVKGKDWDLTKLTRMGENIHKLDKNGYHFCYVFNKPVGELAKIIEVVEPKSGRTLEVTTTQPGVQFYSGNKISSELVGKNGAKYKPHSGFCLETQHLPNTPNLSDFPSTLLLPGEKYEEVVIYNFGVTDKY